MIVVQIANMRARMSLSRVICIDGLIYVAHTFARVPSSCNWLSVCVVLSISVTEGDKID